jgi:hypothetical protein
LVRIWHKFTPSFALWNSAHSSASAANVMTALIMVAVVMIALLFGANCTSLDKKKCPPAQLLLFVLLQYPASLWMRKIILLALYVMIASSCMAQ